jgi:ADP-ribosyl-[dinitrogen reductase] hydrolase
MTTQLTDVESRARFKGCLLGGAIGDALGAPVEFLRWSEITSRFGPEGIRDFAPAYGRLGAITDDTQMTMFTAEGLIRADIRYEGRGICHPPSIVHHAYLRWLHTQGETSAHQLFKPPFDGWLITVRGLHSRRAPGNSCLTGLQAERFGTTEQPINNSKGCGTVMRIAPVGLIASHPFGLGCEIAALTHGHPTGYLAAGFLALLIRLVMHGAEVAAAVEVAMKELENRHNARECLLAVKSALRAADSEPPCARTLESLGAGWTAEEALAISLYCALVSRDFESGVRLAVNHSGDSDSTGAITGNILGVLWGIGSIPERWLEQLELRHEIDTLGSDMHDRFVRHSAPDDARYPGW